MKHFSIYCDVYKTNLLVVGDCTKEQLERFVKRKYKLDISKTYGNFQLRGGTCFDFDQAPYHIIYVKKLAKDPTNLSYLVHELFHHTLRICHHRQIPTEPGTDNRIDDEAAAYLMEFYFYQAYTRL